ncbi:MAG: Ku protein [Bacteroidota bacterium]
MKSIWKGAIGFGLVNVPVKMYTATGESRIDLDMLDKRDEEKIRFLRVNEKTGKEVEWADIVKAYKLDDKYIVLSDDDFKAASAKKSETLEILEFVDETEIDPIYYEQPYYLEPDKGGARSYGLLREALRKSGKVGVVQYVMREREHIAILKALDNVLLLNRIRYNDEIRSANDLELPGRTMPKGQELEMAIKLIENYSGKFKPEQFKDTYTEELLKHIKAKAKGKKPVATEKHISTAKSTDLMAQLKASLEEKRKAS